MSKTPDSGLKWLQPQITPFPFDVERILSLILCFFSDTYRLYDLKMRTKNINHRMMFSYGTLPPTNVHTRLREQQKSSHQVTQQDLRYLAPLPLTIPASLLQCGDFGTVATAPPCGVSSIFTQVRYTCSLTTGDRDPTIFLLPAAGRPAVLTASL